MAPPAIVQRRTHNLLLFQKLLNLRDGASPFTLLLDTMEQSAKSLVREFIVRAKTSKSKIIFISFETLRRPKDASVFIKAHGKVLDSLNQEIAPHLHESTPGSPAAASSKTLIVIDTLNPLAITSSTQLPNFLSSLLSPNTSLVATYHADVPIPSLPAPSSMYAPAPLTTLLYLATSILKVSNLSHEIEKKRARDRSLEEPVFGVQEGREGILIGLKGIKVEGVVVEMEVRRKSGRGVKEVFVLLPSPSSSIVKKAGLDNKICLLEDHPLYKSIGFGVGDERVDEEDGVETTFSLGLSEKQRRDREGVVLPYFDAQGEEGGGDGGRILYEMGREDDWDEEEDEI